ncbi:sesquiterpene synthase Cop-like [Rhododendron vialii]|uniref:sesquiterpene synthase Cop-like n=1 Tax=Rhododendron vialii TaxID=182163 RepID=UPI00265FE37D|nr:sesquiterpene synthase Cop-like [Rhododendron vialii]
MMGVCFEPQYYFARMSLTKVITLTSIMDNIYDIYGTFDELVLFTDAIERWEIRALDQLPDYMKLYYQALLDVYNMIDDEMAKEGKSCATDYAKTSMKNLARSYINEAKWFHSGYAPSVEEYMSVALVSGGYEMLAATSFLGMGELATKEAFEWVLSDHLIIQAASVICRLMDDMASHKSCRLCHIVIVGRATAGDAPSAVECYMKQHGVTEDEALVELRKLVTNAWKDMNVACLHPIETPIPLLIMRVLNLARAIDVLYKDEDNYTNPETKLKGYITSVIINPLQIN